MSETKALNLVCAFAVCFSLVVCALLMALKVNGELLAVACILIGGLSAYLQMKVGLHFEALEKRQRR